MPAFQVLFITFWSNVAAFVCFLTEYSAKLVIFIELAMPKAFFLQKYVFYLKTIQVCVLLFGFFLLFD
jgi:hypothetical protein